MKLKRNLTCNILDKFLGRCIILTSTKEGIVSNKLLTRNSTTGKSAFNKGFFKESGLALGGYMYDENCVVQDSTEAMMSHFYAVGDKLISLGFVAHENKGYETNCLSGQKRGALSFIHPDGRHWVLVHSRKYTFELDNRTCIQKDQVSLLGLPNRLANKRKKAPVSVPVSVPVSDTTTKVSAKPHIKLKAVAVVI
jgi:hypothetical protein